MIIERLGSKVSHDGAYKILYVAFSGYPLEMHLYSDGVKSGCEAAQTMEDALEKNKLSKDFFSKHIESLSDGENCMVIMDEDAERQVRDAIFNSRLNEKIHRAEKQITFHMLDFEAKLAKERKENVHTYSSTGMKAEKVDLSGLRQYMNHPDSPNTDRFYIQYRAS